MEDSGELQSEENRVSSEKNSKRIVKTPAQVMALEEFYSEHKYPSEELKSELAAEIGLTEKQISSWFCHRRLKDKKLKDDGLINGRQDRSSGVIQDRGSGLRQDSCGSTKPGDFRNVDPREVESNRLYGNDFPVADPAHDHTSRYTGDASDMDNTSSESSASLEDKFIPQNEDPYDVETSKYPMQNGAVLPLIPKGSSNGGYKPSGYLKVKVEIENAAITAVKRQLGRHYREDGPPLGVEFQPLPPGGFASPSRDPVNGPVYVGDLGRIRSPNVSGIRKQSSLSNRYEAYSTKTNPTDSYMEEDNCNPEHGTDSHCLKPHRQLKQKSTYTYSNSHTGGNTSMDKYDDIAGEPAAYGTKRNYKMSSKHGVEGFGSDSISNHHGSSGRRVTTEQARPWLHDYDNDSPNLGVGNDYMSTPPHPTLGPGEYHDAEDRALYRRMTKEDKIYGEVKGIKESNDAVRVRKQPTEETIVAKRFRPDFPQQEDVNTMTFPDMPRRTNLTKRPVMEKPSSFSEDETAETSSSGDSVAADDIALKSV